MPRIGLRVHRRLRRDHDTRVTIAFAVLGATSLVASSLALIGRELSTSVQPLIVLAAFAHPLMGFAPFAVLSFALARRWPTTALALVVLALALTVQIPLHLGGVVAPGGTRVQILQANLRLGSATPTSLVDIVRTHQVDILDTEELTIVERDRLVLAGLSRELPYLFDDARPEANGVAIWSRYPLSDEQRYTGFALGAMSATVNIGATVKVTVFATHLAAPFPQPAGLWAAELAHLHRILLAIAVRGPVIVGGDFNATTDTAQFRSLASGTYRDAAQQRGAGYLATYPADRWFPPLLGIDHILLSRGNATSVKTLRLPGSDHRALLAQVRVG
ncbi:MAG: endonuclease/exonuclease/phosphatase family protein [Actinomycetota bacterium]|nr:endonuclease/exonuclease/phosphatase family protein [Actinomycetota bacterium]